MDGGSFFEAAKNIIYMASGHFREVVSPIAANSEAAVVVPVLQGWIAGLFQNGVKNLSLSQTSSRPALNEHRSPASTRDCGNEFQSLTIC